MTQALLAITQSGSRVVLNSAEPRVIPDILRQEVSDEEVKRLEPLATAGLQSKTGALTLKRNNTHRVGQLIFRQHTIIVTPPISGSSFMTLLLTAMETHDHRTAAKFIRELESESTLAPEDWATQFDVLLAYLYVRWTEKILASHIAQTYVRQDERLTVLKGKPLWSRNMGRHPAEGIYCSYFQLQTDNIFNRLVLAGLVKAASLLRGTQWDDRVQNQLFIWHSLAKVAIPRPDTFGLAYSKISRLTEHYRPVLRLGEALLFGHAPRDMFSGGQQWLQGFFFSMPILYEQFLAHLSRQALDPYGLTVKEQFSDRNPMVDGYGRQYRPVRPDIVIFKGSRPVALIDAKYKPQYVEGGGAASLPTGNKVSSADLYQMFFYQARLRYRYGLADAIPSALVSPRLPMSGPLPVKELRSIRWKATDTDEQHSLEVLSLPLEDVLQELSASGSELEAVRRAPELAGFLQRLVNRSASSTVTEV